jgi:hypothetical protein
MGCPTQNELSVAIGEVKGINKKHTDARVFCMEALGRSVVRVYDGMIYYKALGYWHRDGYLPGVNSYNQE